MSDKRAPKDSATETGFSREVGEKAARKLKMLRAGPVGVWPGVGVTGLIGWSVVVPTLLGALLGVWLDQHHPGRHSWTLALLVAGLVLGCANAWHWVLQQDRAMHEEPNDDQR